MKARARVCILADGREVCSVQTSNVRERARVCVCVVGRAGGIPTRNDRKREIERRK